MNNRIRESEKEEERDNELAIFEQVEDKKEKVIPALLFPIVEENVEYLFLFS